MIVDTHISNELILELAELGNELTFTVVTNSMVPLIAAGDCITMKPIKDHRTRIGDIMVFRLRDRFLVHRLIGRKQINGEMFIRHKGDAGDTSSLVPLDSAIGAVRTVNKGDRVIDFETAAWRRLNYILGLNLAFSDLLIRSYRQAMKRLPLPTSVRADRNESATGC